MALFDLDGVGFAYPGFPSCLADISFSIAANERVALLGANGSGKSTLLHLLDGLYFPSTGSIVAFGTALSEDSLDGDFGARFRKEVGFVFQNSDAQLFSPTVREELAFGPLQLKLSRDTVLERVDETLNMLGIAALGDRSPQTLSTGQQKLVALASVLTLAPSVLLLDEPTAGLDPRTQGKLLDLLDALHSAGRTIVCTTHDLPLLSDLADRAIVLGEDHRVAFDGPVDDALLSADLLRSANLVLERTRG